MDLREARAAEALGSSTRHPWERARRAFVLRAISRHGALVAGGRVVDVGAGDAFVADALHDLGLVVDVVDDGYGDAELARLSARGLRPARALSDGPWDVALLLDVLEHVDDDDGLLRAVVRRLVPGGLLVVTVPAWPALFSAHDRALEHRRRYTPACLWALLGDSGVDVVEFGGLFHGLLLPRALAVLRERIGSASGRGAPSPPAVARWRAGPLLTRVVDGALALDGAISRRAARAGWLMPGLSLFAVARAPL